MDTDAGRFRILLAEDDPVSREFLREALLACGASVTDCGDGIEACELARTGRWDLAILDHNLPGCNGDVVLAALREDPARRETPALATSADADRARDALLQAGFSEVLAKPMTLATLHAALDRHGCHPPAMALDDDDALRACGSPQAVARLRRLFAEQELPRVQVELDQATQDPQSLRPTLHRLRASCGFCGAPALSRASAALHRVLVAGAGTAEQQTALAAFRRALADTRVALHAELEADA